MKLVTNLIEIITNTVLLTLLVGIVVISGIAVYALSPVAYETTGQYKEKVLGVQTTENIQDLVNKKIVEVFNSSNTEFNIKSFKGNDGIIVKTSTLDKNLSGELKLFAINNISLNDINYLLEIQVEKVGRFEEFSVNINGLTIPVVFDEEGNFKSPITVSSGNRMEFGLDLINVDGEFTIELINSEINPFSMLP